MGEQWVSDWLAIVNREKRLRSIEKQWGSVGGRGSAFAGFRRSLPCNERAATAEPVALQFRAERGKDAPLRPLRVHLSSARRGKDEERERQISDENNTTTSQSLRDSSPNIGEPRTTRARECERQKSRGSQTLPRDFAIYISISFSCRRCRPFCRHRHRREDCRSSFAVGESTLFVRC